MPSHLINLVKFLISVLNPLDFIYFNLTLETVSGNLFLFGREKLKTQTFLVSKHSFGL